MQFSESYVLSSLEPVTPLKSGNFVERLFENFDYFPVDKTAILDAASGRRMTFADLKRTTIRVASGLVRCGFVKGDVLSLFGSNCIENAPIIFGTAVAGGTIHLVKPAATNEELRFYFKLIGPKVIVTTSNCMQSVLNAVRAGAVEVQDIFVIGDAENDCKRAEELLEDPGDLNPWGQVMINPREDVAMLMHTGGTTGMSKTVMLTHESWQLSFLEAPPLEPEAENEEMCLGYNPFNHVYSQFLLYGRWLNLGCGVVNIDTKDPEVLLRTIEKHKVTRIGLTPVSMAALLACPYFNNANLSSLRRINVGGAAMSRGAEECLSANFLKRAPKAVIDQTYGMTEVGGIATAFPDSTNPCYERKFGSSGVPYPSFELRVVSCDEEKRNCKAGESGQILLRGPRLMKGYLNNEAATRKAIVDGWYYTGDYGYFDEDGFVFAIDRVEDLIHHKNGLIVPTRIEGILRTHPLIQDCAVVGRLIGDGGGEMAMVFVMTKEGNDVTEQEVRDFASEHLSPHEQFDGGVRFVSNIPKSPAGKVLRRLLLQTL